MKMQRVTSPHLKEPAPGTWSNCRVYGNQVFVAGMTASSPDGVLGDGSMYSQARRRSPRSSTSWKRPAAR